MRRTAAMVVLGLLSVLLAGTVSPAYAAESSADTARTLLEKYAPIVVVRQQPELCGSGEPFLPTSVDNVLGRDDVVLRGPGGQSIAGPTSADLAGKGEGWYLDLPGDPLSPGCDFERWFAEISRGKPATIYGRVTQDGAHPDSVVLQYWFYWTYNDWNDKHEGDWEMVQVVIGVPSVQEALTTTPSSMAFAQHEGSETALWTDEKVHREGDHVAVYPAQGSHAAYYTQAQWFGKSAAAGFGCDNTQALGTVVRPTVVVLPDTPTAGFEWLTFTGRWGEKEPSFNNGPTGPNTKTQWAHPIEWQVQEGRPEAVDLPPVGGPAVTGFCSLTAAGSLLFISFLDSPLVVAGILLLVLALIVVLVSRTDWFNNDDPELDRPRKAGQLAVAAVDLVRRRPGAMWLPAALVAGAVALNLILDDWLLRARPGQDLADVNGYGTNLLGIGLALVTSFVLLPVVSMGMATAVEITDGVARHEEIDGVTAFRRVLVHPGGWFVAISVYVVVTLLSTTWWLLPLALWLLARWTVALPATELEDDGPRAGLRHSAALTKGRRLRSMLVGGFLVWLGFSVPSGVGGIVLLLTGWPFWVTNLVSIVVAAVLVPVSAIGLTLLYYDLRARRTDTREEEPARAGA